jgi:hypothetical protein
MLRQQFQAAVAHQRRDIVAFLGCAAQCGAVKRTEQRQPLIQIAQRRQRIGWRSPALGQTSVDGG